MTQRKLRILDWFTWGVMIVAFVYFFWQFFIR